MDWSKENKQEFLSPKIFPLDKVAPRRSSKEPDPQVPTEK